MSWSTFFTFIGVCYVSWILVYKIGPWLDGERR